MLGPEPKIVHRTTTSVKTDRTFTVATVNRIFLEPEGIWVAREDLPPLFNVEVVAPRPSCCLQGFLIGGFTDSRHRVDRKDSGLRLEVGTEMLRTSRGRFK